MARDTLLDSHPQEEEMSPSFAGHSAGPFHSHLGLLKGAKENPGSWSHDGTGQLAV